MKKILAVITALMLTTALCSCGVLDAVKERREYPEHSEEEETTTTTTTVTEEMTTTTTAAEVITTTETTSVTAAAIEDSPSIDLDRNTGSTFELDGIQYDAKDLSTSIDSLDTDGIDYEANLDFWLDTSDIVEKRIEWPTLDGKYNFWVNLKIPQHIYDFYTAQPRYILPKNYIYYINDEYNRGTVQNIASAMWGVCEQYDYDLDESVAEVIRFVQSFTYVTDMEGKGVEEYPKYPVETLYDQCGDCEDLSILLAAILREMGISVCFIDYPTHIAVAVEAGDDSEISNFDCFGKRWLYVETTDFGWNIGEMPEKRIGMEATLYRIC